MQNPNYRQDVPSLWDNKLVYIQKGVLWVQQRPHYIVELIKDSNGVYVAVYEAQPVEGKDDPNFSNPKKAAREVNVGSKEYSPNTFLGQFANKFFPKRKLTKWQEKEVLFIAPIVQKQKATITGKIEDGFFEREPDKMVVERGEKVMSRGRNTGVFIGLSSIEWEDKVRIPTQSILDELDLYNDSLFYDLEGYYDNSNPLSHLYKDRED